MNSDTVLELEELVEFLEKEPIRTKIDEVRRNLEGSAILKSKQQDWKCCWMILLRIVTVFKPSYGG